MRNSSESLVDRGARFRVLYSLVVRSWWILAVSALLGSVLALMFSLYQSPVYRASSTLYVTSGSDPNSQSAYQGSLASQQRVESYVRLVSTDAVLRGAISRVGDEVSVAELRSMVSASASPATVLLTVNVDDHDQARPVRLADAVSESLTDYVSNLEEPAGGGAALAKLTVVSPAAFQGQVSPRTGRDVLLGGLAGFMVGLFAVWIRLRVDNRIRDVSDIDISDDMTALGSVPLSGELVGGSVANFDEGSNAVAESYRKIRTNLEFVSVGGGTKSVLITSASAGDGKTTTAINLAIALAESGERVLLVDADLRRPRVAPVLGLVGDVGLSTVLRGESTIGEVVQTYDRYPRLDVLASGEVPPNASILLSSSAFRATLNELYETYDRIILDCAPVLPVTDALMAGSVADGVVVVVKVDETLRRDFADTVSQLKNGGVRVVGVVANGDAAPLSGYSERYGSYSSH